MAIHDTRQRRPETRLEERHDAGHVANVGRPDGAQLRGGQTAWCGGQASFGDSPGLLPIDQAGQIAGGESVGGGAGSHAHAEQEPESQRAAGQSSLEGTAGGHGVRISRPRPCPAP